MKAWLNFILVAVLGSASATSTAQSLTDSFNTKEYYYFPEFSLSETLTLDLGGSYSNYFLDVDPTLYANTGFELKGLLDSPLQLNVWSGFDPKLGINLDTEKVEPGFLLVDGTLALEVEATDETGARRDVRIGYRMDIRRDSLRARYLRRLLDARRTNEAWADATWLREIPLRRARMMDARLLRFNEAEGRWVRAIRAIHDLRRADLRFMGDSQPDGILGHHGYNQEGGFVWAVLDTNSKYAVGINFDHDKDGVLNAEDNCPFTPNTAQSNADGADDGGDACDTDDDNDGIADESDNCPLVANADQLDYDGNGIGFACETDDDGDGVFGGLDKCPATKTLPVNADGCGLEDLCPCDIGWKNHGSYVRCMAHTTNDFLAAELVGASEQEAIMSNAGESSCGQK